MTAAAQAQWQVGQEGRTAVGRSHGRTCGRDTRRRADELVSTESEAAALQALRTATGEVDGDMERHTVRQYLIAERLADSRGIAYDREVLLCASFLHDAVCTAPPVAAMSTSRTPPATPGERLSRWGGPRNDCESASTRASSTTLSRRGGGCPTRSSLSGGPTSLRCCPS